MNKNELKNGNVLVFKINDKERKYMYMDGQYFDEGLRLSSAISTWIDSHGITYKTYNNITLLGVYKSPHSLLTSDLTHYTMLWKPTNWSEVPMGTPVLVWDDNREATLMFFKGQVDDYFMAVQFIELIDGEPSKVGLEKYYAHRWDNCKLLNT